MNIQEILEIYDQMFGNFSLEEIEAYLKTQIEKARMLKQKDIEFTLLNEMIGFCRDTTQTNKGLMYCDTLKDVLETLNINGTEPYATCLLNLGNAYRAFGKFELALHCFQACEEIYFQCLEANDFGFANLYNNWALLDQEQNDFISASKRLKKALDVVLCYPEEGIKQAITYTNLGTSLIHVDSNEAFQCLEKASTLFEKEDINDFHYNACLVGLGDYYASQNDNFKAWLFYKKGLHELERHAGKNENYQRILEKYQTVDLKLNNLQLSRLFYFDYLKPMIPEEMLQVLAAGMAGEGSDCFGFDDEISKDHDLEIGCCLWLNHEDYLKYGQPLQVIYEKAVYPFSVGRLKERRGVFEIDQFYKSIIQEGEEHQLASATNGEVFEDHLGLFSKRRNELLQYYDDETWRLKIAEKIHLYSQYAQSNYPRMMARNDFITANLCISKAVETAMDLMYLFERTYAPYYKWKRKGLENHHTFLELLDKIVSLPLQKEAWEKGAYDNSIVNQKDGCIVLFEKIAEIFLEYLHQYHLVNDCDLFLEKYVDDIAKGTYMNLVNEIVQLEFNQFDQVQNVGGRASCQDNFETFRIMRQSQYMTWPKSLLESYLNDLKKTEKKGWNLITEKYARMMASTAPDEYETLKSYLRPLSEERIAIQEQLIAIQVSWMERFALKYPKLAGNARVIHTASDQIDDTSYETYLRGEMSTYSEETFMLYARFIVECVQNDEDIVGKIMTNTASLYGFDSLEKLEAFL